jgi:ELWxxDGT repeat protein
MKKIALGLLILHFTVQGFAQITTLSKSNLGLSFSNPHNFIVFENKLYFATSDSFHGTELWVTDTTDSPQLLIDIEPGISSSDPRDFYVFNNKLYFSAQTIANGRELWAFDGTNLPKLVFDIYPGKGSSYPGYFAELNNKLYFSANDSVHG